MGVFRFVFIPSLFPDFCKVVLKNLGGLDGDYLLQCMQDYTLILSFPRCKEGAVFTVLSYVPTDQCVLFGKYDPPRTWNLRLLGCHW